jgi:hypothetical protein
MNMQQKKDKKWITEQLRFVIGCLNDTDDDNFCDCDCNCDCCGNESMQLSDHTDCKQVLLECASLMSKNGGTDKHYC